VKPSLVSFWWNQDVVFELVMTNSGAGFPQFFFLGSSAFFAARAWAMMASAMAWAFIQLSLSDPWDDIFAVLNMARVLS